MAVSGHLRLQLGIFPENEPPDLLDSRRGGRRSGLNEIGKNKSPSLITLVKEDLHRTTVLK
jgi:hypothetical protein